MKYDVVAIRDSVANLWFGLSCNASPEAAVRDFSELINGAPIYRHHAKDFDLYRIAEFNSDSGECYGCDRIHLACGADLLRGDSDGF